MNIFGFSALILYRKWVRRSNLAHINFKWRHTKKSHMKHVCAQRRARTRVKILKCSKSHYLWNYYINCFDVLQANRPWWNNNFTYIHCSTKMSTSGLKWGSKVKWQITSYLRKCLFNSRENWYGVSPWPYFDSGTISMTSLPRDFTYDVIGKNSNILTSLKPLYQLSWYFAGWQSSMKQ